MATDYEKEEQLKPIAKVAVINPIIISELKVQNLTNSTLRF